MQASQIQLGVDYAVRHEGREVELYVSEIRTSKTREGTKNYVVGFLPATDESDASKISREKIIVEVKHVISLASEHREMAAAKARRDAERKAAEAARIARQHYAVQLFADMIKAQPVLDKWKTLRDSHHVDWDQDAAAVIVDSHGLELNEHALEPLIVFLEGVKKERAFLEGSETSLEKQYRLEREMAKYKVEE